MISDEKTQRSTAFVTDGVAQTLTVTSVYAIVATGILWWFEGLPPAIRIPVALPLLLFAPGYAVLTAVAPPRVDIDSDEGPPPPTNRLYGSGLERGMLSVVLSIAIVPMVAVVANFATGIDYVIVLVGVTCLTIGASVVAGLRLPTTRSIAAGSTHRPALLRGVSIDRIKETMTNGATVLAISVLVALVVASAFVSFAGGADNSLETEFYFANGTVPSDNPATAAAAESESTTAYDLRIDHHGDGPQRFTIVVLRDQVDGTTEQAATGSWSEVTRTSTVVEPDETAAEVVSLDQSRWAANTTVRFVLYEGEAGQPPDAGAAHRTLEITVNESA